MDGRRFLCLLLFCLVLGACEERWSEPNKTELPVLQVPSGEVHGLSSGKPFRRAIAPEEVHAYRLALGPGEAAELRIRQRTIDVTVKLVGHEGEEDQVLDFPVGYEGVEELMLLGNALGAREFEVRAEPEDLRPGSYDLEVEFRPADPSDLLWIRAQDAYAAGLRQHLWAQVPDRGAAEKKYHEAQQQWFDLNAEAHQAHAMVRRMEVLWSLGRRVEGLGLLEEAIELYRRSGSEAAELENNIRLAKNLGEIGEKTVAVERLQQVLPTARRLKNRIAEGDVLNSLGYAEDDLGRRDEALGYYRQALTVFRQLGNRQSEVLVLSNIGVVLDDQGASDEALTYYRQALDLHRVTDGVGRTEATVLNNLASALDKTGNKRRALELYREALSVLEELDQKNDQAYIRLNIGRLYSSLGDKDSALRHYEVALDLSRASGDIRLESWVRSNTGAVYLDQGRLDLAEQTLRESLALRRRVEDRRGEAFTLDSLGELAARRDEYGEAEGFFEQALTAWREVKDPRGERNTLSNLGTAAEEQGDLDRALELHRQALDLVEPNWDPEGTVTGLCKIAETHRARGELEPARRSVEKALKLIESLRYRVATEDLRASFIADRRPCYELHVDVLIELSQGTSNSEKKELTSAAFTAAERVRARALIETLRAGGAEPRDVLPLELQERWQELSRKLSARHWRRSRLARRGDSPEVAAADREIAQLLEDLRQVRDQIRVQSPSYAALTDPSRISLAEVQDHLGPQDLLLEYFLGTERSFLWAVEADRFDVFELPSHQIVEEQARRFVAALRESHHAEGLLATRKIGRRLSEMLLTPVAGFLAGKRLLISGEGALQYVPFGAVPTPGSDRSLIVDHEIVTLPSASMLTIERAERDTGEWITVIADPVFTADDPRVTGNAASAEPDASTWSVRAARALDLESFQRLPFTRREAETIAGLAQDQEVFLALDFDANRTLIEDRRLNQSRIVHFATHGVLNTHHPELTGLVLSLVDEAGRYRDGFLRLHDTYHLNLNADLVVLSGCETALGRQVRGDGIVGLVRGFMYAGARGVLASLWKVDDRATAVLMEEVYRGLLRRDLPPGPALRHAQLELLEDPNTAAPYYWAGFVLQGE